MTHPSPKRNMVPKAVLMRSGLVSLTTARPVNTAQPRTTVNSARPMTNVFNKAHSTVRRPINKNTTFKNSNFNQRVNTVNNKNVNAARPKAVVNAARPKAVLNAVKGNQVNAVKASTCWVWKPKTKGTCLYLTDFEEINGGYLPLSNPKEKITVPRKNNMYSVDLKNIVPKGGLTCLFAKATSDESKLWHRRLGHINFKTMNKLVKGNLAEAVNTTCYVQNRVLVTKPHNNTPYELFLGRKPPLCFMKPFRCPVIILNTIDHLDKFDGKADEGLFVGYSINSKAFRVFNSRTKIVEENLHVQFSENTPNTARSGSNCTKACDDTEFPNVGFKPSGDNEKKVTEEPGKEGGDITPRVLGQCLDFLPWSRVKSLDLPSNFIYTILLEPIFGAAAGEASATIVILRLI
ncbi:ribonuclease H-like domain-containing protein [Tanacetum coccineum]